MPAQQEVNTSNTAAHGLLYHTVVKIRSSDVEHPAAACADTSWPVAHNEKARDLQDSALMAETSAAPATHCR